MAGCLRRQNMSESNEKSPSAGAKPRSDQCQWQGCEAAITCCGYGCCDTHCGEALHIHRHHPGPDCPGEAL